MFSRLFGVIRENVSLGTVMFGIGLFLLTHFSFASTTRIDPSLPYRSTLIREAQAVYGVNAPVAMFAGQIMQESGWHANVTAFDFGRGIAQFQDSTSKMISRLYPELGGPDPYNPRWAIRALVRYDGWLYKRVKGQDACQRWGSTLKGYNAGLGYVQRAEARSSNPLIWYDVTENINAGQSAKNFTYSRLYPRWIIMNHQRLYTGWGEVVCSSFIPSKK